MSTFYFLPTFPTSPESLGLVHNEELFEMLLVHFTAFPKPKYPKQYVTKVLTPVMNKVFLAYQTVPLVLL